MLFGRYIKHLRVQLENNDINLVAHGGLAWLFSLKSQQLSGILHDGRYVQV